MQALDPIFAMVLAAAIFAGVAYIDLRDEAMQLRYRLNQCSSVSPCGHIVPCG